MLEEKTEEFYKGLDENWCDWYTGDTKYRKGKTVRIATQRQPPQYSHSSGVLHACRELDQCFRFSKPRQICIVQGVPVVEDSNGVGFYEYKVVRRLPHADVVEMLIMSRGRRIKADIEATRKMFEEYYDYYEDLKLRRKFGIEEEE